MEEIAREAEIPAQPEESAQVAPQPAQENNNKAATRKRRSADADLGAAGIPIAEGPRNRKARTFFGDSQEDPAPVVTATPKPFSARRKARN
jgi:hypothetical protein